MTPIKIYRHQTGEWVADWYDNPYHVTLNCNEEQSFVSLGLVDTRAVRFEINARGVILDITDNQTGQTLPEVTIPRGHGLYRELTIGKPV